MSSLPKIIILVSFSLLIFLPSCTEKEASLPEEINISVSIPPYADFVHQIAGNRAIVHTLIPPGSNAHSFEPSPESLKQIVKSDIYFRVGEIFNFEQVFLKKITSENINKIVDCSVGIKIIENDPHIWTAPNNVKIITRNILDVLVSNYPQHANYFKNNSNRFLKSLDSLDTSIKDNLLKKKNRILLVYHPAWKYLAEHYNLEEIAIEQEGKSPKARDLQKFIEETKEKGASCIFYDPHFDDSAVTAIALSLGLSINSLNPLPTHYLNNLKEIGEKLNNNLK
ncbi:MAG: zinc ABC transporter substrate-binding protein [Melioribacteraceae bacterium]|nr:zinc ABC transporter substrate-binding protein [Melioribacteraceae bacterium]